MGDSKRQVGMGLAVAAILVMVAMAGFALYKGTGRKEKPKDPATAQEYTQMRGMFQQMQQSGGQVQKGGGPPPGYSLPAGPGGMPLTNGRQ